MAQVAVKVLIQKLPGAEDLPLPNYATAGAQALTFMPQWRAT